MKTVYALLCLAIALTMACFYTGDASPLILASGAAATDIDEVAREIKRIVGEFKERFGSTAELDARLRGVEQLAVDWQGNGSRSAPGRHGQLAEAIRQKFIGAPGFAEFKARNVSTGDVDLALDLKALVSDAVGGWNVQPERAPGVWGYAHRPSLLEALVMLGTVRPITTGAVEAHQLDGFIAAAAAQTAEGALKEEQELTLDLEKFPVETVAVWLPISRQLLDDDAQVLVSMQGLLGLTVIAKAEQHLLYGTGNTGQMRGLVTDGTVFVPAGATTFEDRISEAAGSLESTGYSAGLIVVNPLDWWAFQGVKATDSGMFLNGTPGVPAPRSLWGVPLVASSACNVGEQIVLDPRYLDVLDRQRVTARLGFEDGANMRRNLATLLVELRMGLHLKDQRAALVIEADSSSS